DYYCYSIDSSGNQSIF
nr:immunoglobulin light chain junction region [Macaca mulatta]MOW29613.1 immunoglobulin light chain junction region [Macaca mulatta]MOW29773.1 immunoglobulin light chain junction region [Macaca mulatta]MOW29976.1 immunoglobulin light chain junction region [Macaca mulatta]MOW30655.1 immunoglobulin light chain junction region [Macaca mulatta]